MFREPLGEIHKRFRISELVLLSWQSRERAAQMEKRFHKQPKVEFPGFPEGPKVEEFVGEDGIPDVRKMSGQQQLAYLGAAGLRVPLIPVAMGTRK